MRWSRVLDHHRRGLLFGLEATVFAGGKMRKPDTGFRLMR